MRTRVKICGITRPEDALAAVEHGADAIGLVFYSKSPRAVDIETARRITEVVPAFVTVVGLFVDMQQVEIRTILDAVSIDLLQFHGDESPEACSLYGRRYIKAIRMQDNVDLKQCAMDYNTAAGLLVDAYDKQAPGGTGQTFDWNRIPADTGKPVILAGGLTPDNVTDAIKQVHPYAVDVSSGVESGKGIKDTSLIEVFMRGVKSVESD
jgi:phosphoribosylanthranilate isomerase